MINLKTVTEALNFLDAFDGFGMIATDEHQQVEKLRDFDLVDDYESVGEEDEEE